MHEFHETDSIQDIENAAQCEDFSSANSVLAYHNGPQMHESNLLESIGSLDLELEHRKYFIKEQEQVQKATTKPNLAKTK